MICSKYSPPFGYIYNILQNQMSKLESHRLSIKKKCWATPNLLQDPYCFFLKAKASSFFKDNLTASFAPVKSLPQLKSEKMGTYSITPQYNNDKRVDTPAFVLPYDFPLDHCRYRDTFDRRLKHYLRDPSTIYLPKPVGKRYCSVCVSEYEDYSQHIKSSAHVSVIRSNRFNDFILELAQVEESIDKVTLWRNRNKPIRKAQRKRIFQKQECVPLSLRTSNNESVVCPEGEHSASSEILLPRLTRSQRKMLFQL